MDEVVIEWGLTTHSMFANICQTRLRIDCRLAYLSILLLFHDEGHSP